MGLSEFERQVYNRLRPLSSMGIAVTPQMPIRIREPNRFFPQARSWRCSFLCSSGDRYAVIAARTDFSADWLLQLELLSEFNPAALQNLIIVCPQEVETSPAVARLTVLPEKAIAFHLVEKLKQ